MTTRAKQIRDARQESLRELLSNQGHLQHVIELATQIEAVGNSLEKNAGGFDDTELKRLKIAVDAKKAVIDTKMKIINKYLGDVKSVEHSGEVTQTVINDRNLLEDMLREKGIDPERIRTH
jgi:hypothetical protein